MQAHALGDDDELCPAAVALLADVVAGCNLTEMIIAPRAQTAYLYVGGR
jgi:hypothetical protein